MSPVKRSSKLPKTSPAERRKKLKSKRERDQIRSKNGSKTEEKATVIVDSDEPQTKFRKMSRSKAPKKSIEQPKWDPSIVVVKNQKISKKSPQGSLKREISKQGDSLKGFKIPKKSAQKKDAHSHRAKTNDRSPQNQYSAQPDFLQSFKIPKKSAEKKGASIALATDAQKAGTSKNPVIAGIESQEQKSSTAPDASVQKGGASKSSVIASIGSKEQKPSSQLNQGVSPSTKTKAIQEPAKSIPILSSQNTNASNLAIETKMENKTSTSADLDAVLDDGHSDIGDDIALSSSAIVQSNSTLAKPADVAISETTKKTNDKADSAKAAKIKELKEAIKSLDRQIHINRVLKKLTECEKVKPFRGVPELPVLSDDDVDDDVWLAEPVQDEDKSKPKINEKKVDIEPVQDDKELKPKIDEKKVDTDGFDSEETLVWDGEDYVDEEDIGDVKQIAGENLKTDYDGSIKESSATTDNAGKITINIKEATENISNGNGQSMLGKDDTDGDLVQKSTEDEILRISTTALVTQSPSDVGIAMTPATSDNDTPSSTPRIIPIGQSPIAPSPTHKDGVFKMPLKAVSVTLSSVDAITIKPSESFIDKDHLVPEEDIDQDSLEDNGIASTKDHGIDSESKDFQMVHSKNPDDDDRKEPNEDQVTANMPTKSDPPPPATEYLPIQNAIPSSTIDTSAKEKSNTSVINVGTLYSTAEFACLRIPDMIQKPAMSLYSITKTDKAIQQNGEGKNDPEVVDTVALITASADKNFSPLCEDGLALIENDYQIKSEHDSLLPKEKGHGQDMSGHTDVVCSTADEDMKKAATVDDMFEPFPSKTSLSTVLQDIQASAVPKAVDDLIDRLSQDCKNTNSTDIEKANTDTQLDSSTLQASSTVLTDITIQSPAISQTRQDDISESHSPALTDPIKTEALSDVTCVDTDIQSTAIPQTDRQDDLSEALSPTLTDPIKTESLSDVTCVDTDIRSTAIPQTDRQNDISEALSLVLTNTIKTDEAISYVTGADINIRSTAIPQTDDLSERVSQALTDTIKTEAVSDVTGLSITPSESFIDHACIITPDSKPFLETEALALPMPQDGKANTNLYHGIPSPVSELSTDHNVTQACTHKYNISETKTMQLPPLQLGSEITSHLPTPSSQTESSPQDNSCKTPLETELPSPFITYSNDTTTSADITGSHHQHSTPVQTPVGTPPLHLFTSHINRSPFPIQSPIDVDVKSLFKTATTASQNMAPVFKTHTPPHITSADSNMTHNDQSSPYGIRANNQPEASPMAKLFDTALQASSKFHTSITATSNAVTPASWPHSPDDSMVNYAASSKHSDSAEERTPTCPVTNSPSSVAVCTAVSSPSHSTAESKSPYHTVCSTDSAVSSQHSTNAVKDAVASDTLPQSATGMTPASEVGITHSIDNILSTNKDPEPVLEPDVASSIIAHPDMSTAPSAVVSALGTYPHLSAVDVLSNENISYDSPEAVIMYHPKETTNGESLPKPVITNTCENADADAQLKSSPVPEISESSGLDTMASSPTPSISMTNAQPSLEDEAEEKLAKDTTIQFPSNMSSLFTTMLDGLSSTNQESNTDAVNIPLNDQTVATDKSIKSDSDLDAAGTTTRGKPPGILCVESEIDGAITSPNQSKSVTDPASTEHAEWDTATVANILADFSHHESLKDANTVVPLKTKPSDRSVEIVKRSVTVVDIHKKTFPGEDSTPGVDTLKLSNRRVEIVNSSASATIEDTSITTNPSPLTLPNQISNMPIDSRSVEIIRDLSDYKQERGGGKHKVKKSKKKSKKESKHHHHHHDQQYTCVLQNDIEHIKVKFFKSPPRVTRVDVPTEENELVLTPPKDTPRSRNEVSATRVMTCDFGQLSEPSTSAEIILPEDISGPSQHNTSIQDDHEDTLRCNETMDSKISTDDTNTTSSSEHLSDLDIILSSSVEILPSDVESLGINPHESFMDGFKMVPADVEDVVEDLISAVASQDITGSVSDSQIPAASVQVAMDVIGNVHNNSSTPNHVGGDTRFEEEYLSKDDTDIACLSPVIPVVSGSILSCQPAVIQEQDISSSTCVETTRPDRRSQQTSDILEISSDSDQKKPSDYSVEEIKTASLVNDQKEPVESDLVDAKMICPDNDDKESNDFTVRQPGIETSEDNKMKPCKSCKVNICGSESIVETLVSIQEKQQTTDQETDDLIEPSKLVEKPSEEFTIMGTSTIKPIVDVQSSTVSQQTSDADILGHDSISLNASDDFPDTISVSSSILNSDVEEDDAQDAAAQDGIRNAIKHSTPANERRSSDGDILKTSPSRKHNEIQTGFDQNADWVVLESISEIDSEGNTTNDETEQAVKDQSSIVDYSDTSGEVSMVKDLDVTNIEWLDRLPDDTESSDGEALLPSGASTTKSTGSKATAKVPTVAKNTIKSTTATKAVITKNQTASKAVTTKTTAATKSGATKSTTAKKPVNTSKPVAAKNPTASQVVTSKNTNASKAVTAKIIGATKTATTTAKKAVITKKATTKAVTINNKSANKLIHTKTMTASKAVITKNATDRKPIITKTTAIAKAVTSKSTSASKAVTTKDTAATKAVTTNITPAIKAVTTQNSATIKITASKATTNTVSNNITNNTRFAKPTTNNTTTSHKTTANSTVSSKTTAATKATISNTTAGKSAIKVGVVKAKTAKTTSNKPATSKPTTIKTTANKPAASKVIATKSNTNKAPVKKLIVKKPIATTTNKGAQKVTPKKTMVKATVVKKAPIKATVKKAAPVKATAGKASTSQATTGKTSTAKTTAVTVTNTSKISGDKAEEKNVTLGNLRRKSESDSKVTTANKLKETNLRTQSESGSSVTPANKTTVGKTGKAISSTDDSSKTTTASNQPSGKPSTSNDDDVVIIDYTAGISKDAKDDKTTKATSGGKATSKVVESRAAKRKCPYDRNRTCPPSFNKHLVVPELHELMRNFTRKAYALRRENRINLARQNFFDEARPETGRFKDMGETICSGIAIKLNEKKYDTNTQKNVAEQRLTRVEALSKRLEKVPTTRKGSSSNDYSRESDMYQVS